MDLRFVKYSSFRWMWFVLLGLTIIRLWVAAYSPISPDEAYYWLWSKHLDYSFYDHPPMVALWIKGGCWLVGKTFLGVRFFAPFAALLGSVFIFFATLDFSHESLNKEKNAIIAVLLLNATLAIGIGSVTMTPDTPLLFFICVFLWGCGRLIASKHTGWWLFIGASAGCALLSKYTAILMIIALGIWCFITSEGRLYLYSKMMWLGGLITCLFFLPVIIWNAHHQWISFAKQGGRAADWNPHRAIQFLLELLGGQVGLATPFIFLCFCGAFIVLTRIAWQKKQAASILLWLFLFIPSCVFIQHAFGDRVQANWVGIIYPVLAISAGLYIHRFVKTVSSSGYIIISVIYIQTVYACFPVPSKLDITLKRLGGWKDLMQQIALQIPATEPIIVDEYGLAAELAFYGIDHPVISTDKRWRYFDLPQYSGKTGYLIRTQRRKDSPPSLYFASFKKKGVLIRHQKERIAESYNIYQVTMNISKDNRQEIVVLP